uniref:EGF-like domain-containing protein n=1 Tax=Cyprinus carpio TaxID=7962 RepID=A0A8C1PQS0_CYPCA
MISKFCCIYLLLCSGFLPPRRGPSLCQQNPCLNGGICATAAYLNSFDCVCPDGFTGALCEKKQCYRDSGALYRGVASVTVSGSSCLPWNSDLLFSELTLETVESAARRGLGEHAFCRFQTGIVCLWCFSIIL